jgi:hypothetical protein
VSDGRLQPQPGAEQPDLAMLAKRLDRVAECFRTGGGVSYAEFRPDFTEHQDAFWRRLYDGLLVKGFLRQRIRGSSQRTSSNRAKSVSAEHTVSPCSMARAAIAASLTRLPRNSYLVTSWPSTWA